MVRRYQQQGIDFDETFSPVVKPSTIRTVLSLAVSRDWPIHQLDVKNVFLHGQLSETVYMHQPPGFVDTTHPDYHSKTDASLFVFHRGSDIAYLLLYMDDIVPTASSTALLQRIITVLHEEILERAHMQHCNPCRTLVDTESKLGSDGDPVSDPTLYRSLAGALRYLTFTRPDISYAVQQIHASTTAQLTAYTDADWAGCPVTRRSTLVLRTAEDAGVANVVAGDCVDTKFVLEYLPLLPQHTLVYCVLFCAMYLSTNLFSISVLNTSRLIFILSETMLPLVKFVFYTLHPGYSMQISFPKGCLPSGFVL
ncbi:ribonuclease H-like domain-containing protein [Tanacetum coccineum]